MKQKILPFALLIAVVALVFVGLMAFNKNNAGTNVLANEGSLRVTLSPNGQFVVIRDRKLDNLEIPLVGDVGVEVAFVNQTFVALNIVSSAGLGHLESGVLINRTTGEFITTSSDRNLNFLGFTQDGTAALMYNKESGELILRNIHDEVLEIYQKIVVVHDSYSPDFFPLRANFSPDNNLSIIEGIGFFAQGSGDRDDERYFWYALSLNNGQVSPVSVDESYATEIEWIDENRFELWQKDQDKNRLVATYRLAGDEWQKE